ncbi:TPA: hypothetical protein R3975_004724 [Salmonella enterica subsp. enterica serovar Muenchen]|nr:hypothetical protein [Salmonella enterica subsp. enterica]EDM1743981.1 hypothetical protein [Salmonella enterica subsp. enterica serovar Muenchen]EHX6758503.1 hypothetical protein [Salmonella enterica subsp. enterica serovar Chester]HAK0844950.1 hypothetical protein [Salmonella enterica]EHZ1827057.1 hypothetical protein [Salmonella enterica subsp. enterica serovar Chester]
MKTKLIAISVASIMSFIAVNAANAATYSTGTPITVTANVVSPTTVTAQYAPAADSFTVDDLKGGATIGTVSINADVAPSGWWFSTLGSALTAETKNITLHGPNDAWFTVGMPEKWSFSTDNGGIMWISSDNKSSVTFDLKANPADTYNLAAGKYSVTLNVGTYMS